MVRGRCPGHFGKDLICLQARGEIQKLTQWAHLALEILLIQFWFFFSLLMNFKSLKCSDAKWGRRVGKELWGNKPCCDPENCFCLLCQCHWLERKEVLNCSPYIKSPGWRIIQGNPIAPHPWGTRTQSSGYAGTTFDQHLAQVFLTDPTRLTNMENIPRTKVPQLNFWAAGKCSGLW